MKIESCIRRATRLIRAKDDRVFRMSKTYLDFSVVTSKWTKTYSAHLYSGELRIIETRQRREQLLHESTTELSQWLQDNAHWIGPVRESLLRELSTYFVWRSK